jgi:hypothetical protein
MEYVPTAPLYRELARLSRQELVDRLHAVRALGATRGLRYLDDYGRARTIDMALLPWVLTPTQIAFFYRVAQLLADALLILPWLYGHVKAARQILRLDPAQESWLQLASRPMRRPLAVVGRLDSTATFAHATWRTTFKMLEPNAVGVGGVHYAPAACSVILDVLGDVLQRAYPGRRIVPTPDPRALLLDELRGVGRRLGRRVRRVALIENTDYTTGTDEFGSLARHLSQQGLQAVVADPRDLHLRHGRLTAKDLEVDLLYRDCELDEFIEIASASHRLTALRRAICEGRLVSGLWWEFDQKSAWELFTDPVYARYFSPAQRHFFRERLPWTRLVRQAQVSDAAGRHVDLVPYIRRHKNRFVLKPNTLYGGEGVVVGDTVSQAVWERTLGRALHGDERYVVQQRARIHTERFPVLEDGRVRQAERRVVSGFFFNSSGVGLVGRFSTEPVVNVSRGGGLLCALMVQ